MATEIRYWKREGHEHHSMVRNARMTKKEMLERKDDLIRERPSGTAWITFDYTNERNSKGGMRPSETIWGSDQ